MNSVVYQELSKLLRELTGERNQLQAQINENNLSIQETQCFTREILNKEDEDFKVFSPRKIEDIYKAELEQFGAKKTELEQQNSRLAVEKNKLNSIITVLEMIQDTESSQSNDGNESMDFRDDGSMQSYSQEVDRQKIARNLYDSALQNLTRLIHKVELSSKFITQDPIRAKQELNMIHKNIEKIMNEVKKAIYDLCPQGFDSESDN